ncbi:OmpW/AlkL family protein [Pseudodonghicola flavimaris]|uniref:OmpW family outer membrane protein n=1 Tax=Pseudodonghicola flavimaris TaxID=3050036 RepID=A0ABT7EV18_9RHOB|nr:OmpW family outer membrane protein [Pseudodonghicola flavimaris]MDK3016182.1 OmpW family outer membrane protein [Pseudodonghicola flavimaris]
MTRQAAALVFSTALAAVLAGPLAAQSQGDWTLGFGLGYVDPKSDNGTLAGASADVGDNAQPIFTAEYFFRDNWGVEILAATPFKHNVFVGGGYAATVKQLPPVVSVNYHVPTQTAFKPFFGLGVNYTTFFEESSPLGNIELDDSWGVAVQAGLDYEISDKNAVRFNVRWIDINSDVTLNGANIGEAEIDPWVVAVSYVHRF